MEPAPVWNEGDTNREHQVLALEDKEKMGFLVDTVHRVGVSSENTTRPVIMQFTMQRFHAAVGS